MSSKHYAAVVVLWIYVLVTALGIYSNCCAQARDVLEENRILGVKRKGTIKTIESPEDGDLIDCVDFYQQPAFEDPIIKDLHRKMESRLYSSGSDSAIRQSWRKYGECPEGTIPIRRIRENDIHRKPVGTIPFGAIPGRKPVLLDSPDLHEYVTVSQPSGHYLGASGHFNIWSPRVQDHEFSLAQMWLVALTGAFDTNINSMEAGWIVYPDRYHDAMPRFFVHWTSDSYQKTGCYDLDCNGFVQTSKDIIPGLNFPLTSVYLGEQYETAISIHLKEGSENWWLEVENHTVGYFPPKIFPEMGLVQKISWGGEIVNMKTGRQHTTTEMGSGHFSSGAAKKAAFVRHLKIMDILYEYQDPYLDPSNYRVTNSACYDLTIGGNNTKFGTHFFYGGPGRSAACP